MNITLTALKRQLTYVKKNGFFDLLKAAADKYDLPLAYVLAVASRETNMRHMLGDGGHGVGIIQIDIRYHEIAARMKADGTWKTHPAPLIDYGVRLLRTNCQAVRARYPAYTPWQCLKVAASGYNCGITKALRNSGEGDSDLGTTGRDYGRDVMERMAALEELLKP